jgi:hypothetical protein
MLGIHQKELVRNAKHIALFNYPVNWQELPLYQNWYNSRGELCGFVEMVGPSGKYLTSTVY